MREYPYLVQGDPVTVRVVEHENDLDGFRDFVRANLRGLAVDSETTGLDTFSPTNTLRLVQFGNRHDAWVVPVERGDRYADDVRRALLGLNKLIIHNASFDLNVFDRKLAIPQELLWGKTIDTQILAKLIDPRARDKGGVGTSLEDLTGHHISAELATEVKGLMSRLAHEHKTTKARIWKIIDLSHPGYNLYAGMDCILAARLVGLLMAKVPVSARALIGFEHEVAAVCSYMERGGFLLDEDYTRGLSTRLREEETKHSEVALSLGCENVNSTDQVADVLESRGVRINGRTPSGKRQVNATLLDGLAATGDEFAHAVKEAKKARKWRTTWVDTFLTEMDEHGRCHPRINTLQARTGRMSITGIPAQTLPANDWLIRRCFVAEDGHRLGSVDYKGQELRVLASLSGDRTMIDAFRRDDNLHLMTAHAAFGAHVKKDTKEYKAGKMTNFARVFGGGPKVVAEQAGIPFPLAKKVTDAFDRRYPGVSVYARRLQQLAAVDGYVTTPSGRRLPVDAGRAYSALNYVVQSTSRDVTCRGLIRLHKVGYTPYLRLPIHDEVVASLPSAKAERGAGDIARLMAEDMGPVRIDTSAEVGKRSWGSLYGSDY